MAKSLIRKNQLHPDINDLVGQYGSGYFTSINNLIATGQVLQNQINTAVYITGNQTISGLKNFTSRLSVNGTGVLLSGEAAQLPSTILYTTGNQTITGPKNFTSRPTFNNVNLITTGDLVDLELNISGLTSIVSQSENTFIRITGNQSISGVKTFIDSGVFTNGIDLQNTSLINAVPSFITETENFLISGNDNGRVIIAVSNSAITGTIVSGNTNGFNTTIIQGGNGQVRITGVSNIVIREFGNQFRTAGISAIISLLHTGQNSYIMYGNTAP